MSDTGDDSSHSFVMVNADSMTDALPANKIVQDELPSVPNIGPTYLDTPDKSESDKKNYRMFKLPNKLTVLLISEPPHPKSVTEDAESASEGSTSEHEDESEDEDEGEERLEKLAACAMCVNVGSFRDPTDAQGMAHFLEHMIFMGSEKYPGENEFDAYIKKHGGSDNAHTECEETGFYFEISEAKLDGALDRFASMFASPLLKRDSMERERQAIDSEFDMQTQSDSARRDQLLANMANPEYPCSKFAWGNMRTLKGVISDDALYAKLHAFRLEHYSANQMNLCLQARLELDEMQEKVIKYFSDIKNNERPDMHFANLTYSEAFRPEFSENIYFVKPIAEVSKIELTWILPSFLGAYKSKPQMYLSYILGYEGKGSLCSYLRKKFWVVDLIAGINDDGFEHNTSYAMLSLSLILTESGSKNIPEILRATYSYLKTLAIHADNSERLFAELKYIEDTQFRYQTERDPIDNVGDIVVAMKYYPPKDILTGSELYFEYDGAAIASVMKALSTQKFNIMITTRQLPEGLAFDQKETMFGTEFTTIPISKEWQDYWDESRPSDDFYLPEPNEFITKDFSLHVAVNGKNNMSAPEKIYGNECSELWYRQDDKFMFPNAFMYFYFISPLPLQTPENSVLFGLYGLYLKFLLAEELYPASVAGYSFVCNVGERGLIVKVYGYNEHLHKIVDIVVRKMNNFADSISEVQFDNMVKQLRKNYYNLFIKPKSLNRDIRLNIVEKNRWTYFDKHRLAKDVGIEDLRMFSKGFLYELKMQVLMQGNLTPKEAISILKNVESLLQFKCIDDKSSIECRTANLPHGETYVVVSTFNINDSNTVVTNFYQLGPCSIRDSCLLELVVMMVEEPLFDQLRTKEQLGYDVSMSVRENNCVLGYTITVNSQETKYSAAHVQTRIENFRQTITDLLDKMTDDDFNEVREALINAKQLDDNELQDEVSRNWSEITNEEYIFDRLRREVECIREITKADVIEFYKTYTMNTTNSKKLSVQVVGSSSATEMDSTVETSTLTAISTSTMDTSSVMNSESTLSVGSDTENTSYELTYIQSDARVAVDKTYLDDINKFRKQLKYYPTVKTVIDTKK